MEHHEVTASFKVYYEDVDPLGVVYYANYFAFLERGRAEYLESLGRSVVTWNELGYLFVVHSLTASFRRPARLGDVIDVITSVELVSAYRARFHQRIEDAGQLVMKADIDIACIDANQELRTLPDTLRVHPTGLSE